MLRAPFDGPRSVGLPVFFRAEVGFSEPLDPDAGAGVALVAWETVGDCSLSPVCVEGSCEAGRCQVDPVDAGTWRALADGRAPEEAVPIEVWISVEDDPEVPGHMVIVPRRALAPHARYSLLLGAGVRDRRSNPLVDPDGLAAVVRWDFVTAGEGSGGPEARLRSPAANAVDVPPNVQHLSFHLRRPVTLHGDEVVDLVAEDGARVRVEELELCDGVVPGYCVVGTPVPELELDTWYRVEGNSLVDRNDRRGVPPHVVEWFRTTKTPLTAPPDLSGVDVRLHGACALATGLPPGLASAALVSDEGNRVSARPTAEDSVGIRIGDLAGVRVVTLEVEDLVGSAASRSYAITRESDRPALEITEILANAAGTESANEFVEVRVPRGAPSVDTSGLRIADVEWTAVLAAVADGGSPPGDDVPATTLEEGDVALIVGEHFSGETLPQIPAETPLLRVDGTIATGGLKNAGEPITIYRADPLTLVASYGDHLDTSAKAFDGVSVVSVPGAVCDLPSSWRPALGGQPTPGVAE